MKEHESENKSRKGSAQNEKEESLGTQLYDNFMEWMEDYTVHGCPNISKAKYTITRILWVIVVFAMIGYLTYMIYTTTVTYLQYPTSVSIDLISPNQAEFPAVTICNLNAFDVATTQYSGDYINTVLQAKGLKADLLPTESQDAISLIDDASEVLKASIIANTSLTSDNLKDIGFTLDTMFVSCYFDGVKCSVADFTWSYSYQYGNCYTFNYQYDDNGNNKSVVMTSKSGPNSGLIMELFAGSAGEQDFYAASRGLYVQIGKRTDKPLVKYKGIRIPVGTDTSVEVRKEVTNGLPYPYSDCRDDLTPRSTDSIYYRYTANLTTYYQHLCVDIYYQLTIVVQNCGCYEANSPIYDNTINICDTLGEIECAKNQVQYMNTPVSDDDCPKECSWTTYKTSVNIADYPTDYYATMLLGQAKILAKFEHGFTFTPYDATPTTTVSTTPGISDLQSSFAKIKIHLDSLEYTSIDSSPAFDSDAYIGALGGLFGLFLGASIVSVIQALSMLAYKCFLVIKHLVRSKKNNQSVSVINGVEPQQNLKATEKHRIFVESV